MPDGRPRREGSGVVKRSLQITGHATSISLEKDFWDGLKSIAAKRNLSVAAVVAGIDAAQEAGNLSSAIRVFVLRHYQEEARSKAGRTAVSHEEVQ